MFSRRSGLLLLLYAAIATSLGHVDYRIRSAPERGFAEYSPGVVAGTEPAPGRYRVLAPFAYDAMMRLTGMAPRESWVLFRWLSLFAALLAAHWYFRAWFDDGAAMAGSLLMGIMLPLTFTNGWAHPDHLIELFLFTLGCACIVRDRVGWFAAVLVANALNRETSAFLLPLFLFARPFGRTRTLQTGALTLAWTAVYLGLRWWLGFQTYDPWQAGRNLEFLRLLPPNWDPYYRAFAWFVVVMILPMIAAAAVAWAQLPRFVRAATAVVAPAFLVVGFLFSSIIETRIFTPLLPMLVPAVLFALFDRSGR